jgi:hypothetical protein
VRAVGELDVDHVGRADEAAHEHDPHDAGLADEVAVRVTVEDGTHEAVLVAVDLRARVAQAGQLDDGVVAEVEPGADGQAEQVDAAGRDVLAEVAGRQVNPRPASSSNSSVCMRWTCRRFGGGFGSRRDLC